METFPLIRITDEFAIDADKYQFILNELKHKEKTGEPYWKPVGYYPTLSTLISGLSDMQMYDAVRRCGSLKAVQDDLVGWAEGFKTPLVSDLRKAVRQVED